MQSNLSAFDERIAGLIAVHRLRIAVGMGLSRACRRLRIDATLPNSKTHAGWTFALFVAVQIADGILTSIGVARYGTGVEANPLLVHSMLSYGSWTTLFAAKTVAVLGGSLLHVYAYDFVLAALTVGYVFATVLPWSLLLG